MTPPNESAQAGAKLLEIIKDLPLWLLVSIAIAVNIFLFFPQLSADISKDAKPWLIFVAVLFTVLAIVRAISLGVQWWRSWKTSTELRRTFHLTPIGHLCQWSASKQSDDSVVIQLAADFMVKNRTQGPIGLVSARVIKPSIPGEVLQDLILVRAAEGRIYGSAQASDHTIPAGKTLPARVVIMIRGTPKVNADQPLPITLGITDDDGNEQRVRVIFKGLATSKAPSQNATLEAPFTIMDPLEKEVVSVLQSELNRYDKCGRSVGGLGSVHIVFQGHAMTGVGGDSWNSNSPKNQSIANNPEVADLQSDNLDALLALYARVPSENDKKKIVAVLLNRIDESKGYLRVSYFIVCALWRLGHLHDALHKAKTALPQGEIKEFGLSNVLMMLNGLLRYRHPDFDAEKLDEIEGFVHGMSEHTFMIAEKIAAIRAMRLLGSTDSPIQGAHSQ